MPLPSPTPRRGVRLTIAAATRTAWPIPAAMLLLCLLNLALQLALHAGAFDNGILSAQLPSSYDALEYARAARIVAHGAGQGPGGFSQGFAEAFGKGWRVPGYPLFLALFQGAAQPWRAARFAQLALTAPIGAIFCLTIFLLTKSRRRAVVGGLLATAWVPLYHYTPALLAEAPSLALMSLLLPVLARRRATAAGVLVAALAYLKPNHVLLLVPVAISLYATGFELAGGREAIRGRRTQRLGRPLWAVAVTLALLAPWSMYVSRRQGVFVPLAMTSGYNLLLGTGRVPNGDPAALPSRVARALGIPARPEEADALKTGDPAAAPGVRDAAWSSAARALWKRRPLALAAHGGAKILHAFGFSLRGARDALLALFLAATVVAGWRLWRRGMHRAWVLFALACGLTVAAQAFVYLPNQRLKTVMFDPAALLVIALALPAGRERAPTEE